MFGLFRTLASVLVASCALLIAAGPAFACGGLIGPNGAVNLLRTTTLAGYHDGVEHYVTAFQFAGGGGQFGSLVPLPGVPTSVERGGDWTLQRLIRETQPVPEFAAAPAAGSTADAEILLTTRIDALDITVLRGGSNAVGQWATDHGFRLPPDSPEVLDFYTARSPIFMAAVFDADAARERGQAIGDGTPVHITIPTANPWVPLRILALGKAASEVVQADVYLLTDTAPSMLPNPANRENGLSIAHSAPATDLLLDDLRSDAGMGWVPSSAWLTQVAIDGRAADVRYDLAIDASGRGQPSAAAAGMPSGFASARLVDLTAVLCTATAAVALVVGVFLMLVARRSLSVGGPTGQ